MSDVASASVVVLTDEAAASAESGLSDGLSTSLGSAAGFRRDGDGGSGGFAPGFGFDT